MNIGKNFCTIYLVRHGETEWNKAGILMGQLDSPLTKSGIEQVAGTARDLEGVDFKAVFSSDLQRAVKTAEIIKLDRGIVVQTRKTLRERCYGRLEGSTIEEYRKKFKKYFEKLKALTEKERRDYKLDYDIESDGEIIERMAAQLRGIALEHLGETVLVVSHGSCIMTFLTHLGRSFADWGVGGIANNGYAVILYNGKNFIVKDVKGIKNTE